jgi:hypothetical protein
MVFIKRILLIFSIMIIATNSNAQTAADFIKQAEAKQLALDEIGALSLYEKAILKDVKNIKAICAASFLCSKIGERQKSNANKISFFKNAKSFAESATKLAPSNAEAYYVLSVALGANNTGSPKEKLATSKLIKQYAEKALVLNPNHAGANHVLGKYNYEISQLNAIQKGAVAAFYGGMPAGDIKTAIKHFEKCKAIDKNYIKNLLDLAIAYKTDGQKAKAKSICNEIALTTARYSDDIESKAEAKKILKSLG